MATLELLDKLQHGKQVHCQTREEAGAFLRFLNSAGFFWPSLRKAEETDHWDQFEGRTVYGLYHTTGPDFRIMYDSVEHVMPNDIIPFADTGLSVFFPVNDIILVIEDDERTGMERNLLMTIDDVISAYFAIGDVDEDRMVEIVKAANDLGETKAPWKRNSWARLEIPEYAYIEAATYTHVFLRYCADCGQLVRFLARKDNSCPAMVTVDLEHSHPKCVKVAESLGYGRGKKEAE